MSSNSLHRFTQLDVFSSIVLRGNPLAVVHDADTLDIARMLAFANWTNLSETTFLLRPSQPDADYRVRIFTPTGEVPFAGHPTLGTCGAWLRAGGTPRNPLEIVQECSVGLVRIRHSNGRLAFAAPKVAMTAVSSAELATACSALHMAPASVRAAQWVDNGVRMLVLLLSDAATALAVEPDHQALSTFANTGLVAPYPPGADAAFEVRAFADLVGIKEDPVTGSLNAMLAQWLMHIGAAPDHYVASQGTRLGRAGRVYVDREDADTWIGGELAFCIDGTVAL